MGPTPRLVLITVVGTLAYLGLAVVGLGGFAAFFSHPALVVLAIAFFALSGVALFSGGNLSPGVREDRTNRWVIVAFGLIGLLAAYLPATQTGRASGRLTVRPYAGLALFSLPPVARCGSGPSLCSGTASAGGYPAQAGDEWCVWRHSPPKLSGIARQLAGVGPRLSIWHRGAAYGAHYPSAPGAHTCGRDVATLRVWPRLRCVLRSHN